MAQTNPDRTLSLSLSGQKAGQKQKGQILAVSAQLMALVSAQVALQRCPILCTSADQSTTPFPCPFDWGTFLLCRLGDISTLH